MDTLEAGAIITSNDRKLKEFIELIWGQYKPKLLYKIALRLFGEEAVGEEWTKPFKAGQVPPFYLTPALSAYSEAMSYWSIDGEDRRAIDVLPSEANTARAFKFLVDLADGVLPLEAIPNKEAVEAVSCYFGD